MKIIRVVGAGLFALVFVTGCGGHTASPAQTATDWRKQGWNLASYFAPGPGGVGHVGPDCGQIASDIEDHAVLPMMANKAIGPFKFPSQDDKNAFIQGCQFAKDGKDSSGN
jgi:hypothetical protein